MTQPTPYLEQILTEMTQLQLDGKKCLAVFDLDSTLFDVGPRLKKILHDFATDPVFIQKYPDACQLLIQAETQKSDWGIKDAVMRAGLGNHLTELHQDLLVFWKQRFFSNEYLHFDIPYPGAVAFLGKLKSLDVDIVYLTGRDTQRMGIGSAEVITRWQMPLDESKARLVLKPEKGMDDAEFKSDWFSLLPGQRSTTIDEKKTIRTIDARTENLGAFYLKKAPYHKIWFFENEPVNVNLIRCDHKNVEIVFFDSTHSRKEEPPIDVPKIINFLFSPDEVQES